MVNIYGKLPGKEVVILGSGDIGLIMARRLTLEGAKDRNDNYTMARVQNMAMEGCSSMPITAKHLLRQKSQTLNNLLFEHAKTYL